MTDDRSGPLARRADLIDLSQRIVPQESSVNAAQRAGGRSNPNDLSTVT